MALFPLYPGTVPVGDFDLLDTDTLLGGEVMTLDEASRTVTTTEKAAADVLDGYVADLIDVGTAGASRLVARLADSGATDDSKIFYLSDDGDANYGTLFGRVIGTPVGLSTTGSQLGPKTYAASGKVTLWGQSGLYSVTLDAVHSDPTSVANGQLASGADTPLPGDILYRHATNAKLARAASITAAGANTAGNEIAVFVEMANNNSLVTTHNNLISSVDTFDRINIHFLGAHHNV